MELELVPVGSAIAGDYAAKPFVTHVGFNEYWWSGSFVEGPVEWYRVDDATLGEVARVELKLNSHFGDFYPTRPALPPQGATCISLLEVRQDLRRGTANVGRRVVQELRNTVPGVMLAESKDDASDGFWRRIGWQEHLHREDCEVTDTAQPRHCSLFSSS